MSRVNEKFQVSPPKGYKWLVVSTPIAGLSYHQEEALNYIGERGDIEIVRDAGNTHDINAIAIYNGTDLVGFLPKEIAAIVARLPDETPLSCAVRRIYLSDDENHIDIDIAVFAETKYPTSDLVDECKEAIAERFECDEDEEDDELKKAGPVIFLKKNKKVPEEPAGMSVQNFIGCFFIVCVLLALLFGIIAGVLNNK